MFAQTPGKPGCRRLGSTESEKRGQHEARSRTSRFRMREKCEKKGQSSRTQSGTGSSLRIHR
jgi:hypothetical protein